MAENIVRLANSFYLKVFAQENKAVAIVQKMNNLAKSCLLSTNHLLKFPKYQKSPGLNAINKNIPYFIDILGTYNYNNSASVAGDNLFNKLDAILGGISFYVNSGNTGTGKDPMVWAKEEGYTSPGYYVANLVQLTSSLKKFRPVIKDPLNENVLNNQQIGNKNIS